MSSISAARDVVDCIASIGAILSVAKISNTPASKALVVSFSPAIVQVDGLEQ